MKTYFGSMKMKTFVTRVTFVAIAAALISSTAAEANGKGLKVGKDENRLTQTRISNSGGGASGNPRWGSSPNQDPWSGEEDVRAGENFGEAFQGGGGTKYNGHATFGEDGPWDIDPGNSGKKSKGGNAAN